MPNRIIKESIRTSRTLAKLSSEAERMLWRLVTVADDYGRFDADPRVLAATCFTCMYDQTPLPDIERWREELAAVGLIRLYDSSDRLCGYFPTWSKHQRQFGLKSKFPPPPEDSGKILKISGNSGSDTRSAERESRDKSEIRDPKLDAEREKLLKANDELQKRKAAMGLK